MVNKKISELAQASTIGGADLVPVVQAGATKQATVLQLLASVLPAGGTNGQVLGLVNGQLAWVTPATGSTVTYTPLAVDTDGVYYTVTGAYIAVDTDGVPYYTSTPDSSSKSVLTDTDGVYYYA